MLVHRYLIAPYAERVEVRILPMTYVPKSTKLILEAKQQLHNDVVQHSFIISYNIQYTHILDELTSYIMDRKEFIAFLQIIG